MWPSASTAPAYLSLRICSSLSAICPTLIQFLHLVTGRPPILFTREFLRGRTDIRHQRRGSSQKLRERRTITASGRPGGSRKTRNGKMLTTSGASGTSSRQDKLLDFSMVQGLRKNWRL